MPKAVRMLNDIVTPHWPPRPRVRSMWTKVTYFPAVTGARTGIGRQGVGGRFSAPPTVKVESDDRPSRENLLSIVNWMVQNSPITGALNVFL
jgi:hypothetical protein